MLTKPMSTQIGISRENILQRNLTERCPEDKLLTVLKTGLQVEGDEYYDKTLGYNIVAHFIPLKNENEVKGVAGVGNANALSTE